MSWPLGCTLLFGFSIDANVNILSPCSKIKVMFDDQETLQSQTADEPVAPRDRATQQSRVTRETKHAKQPAFVSPSR